MPVTDPPNNGLVDGVPGPATPSVPLQSGNAEAAAWHSGAPLGGVAPQPAAIVEESSRRDLVLTAILLLAALAAGASSLMGWRDVGAFASGSETGWHQFDGSLGRGWVAVLGGVLLAVAGVLVASEHLRSGRLLATSTGIALMVFSVLEWGLGLRNVRSGPGAGLWMLFVVGLMVVVAVGALAPDQEDRVGVG